MTSHTASDINIACFLWSVNVQALAGSVTASLNHPTNRFHTDCNLAMLQASLHGTSTFVV